MQYLSPNALFSYVNPSMHLPIHQSISSSPKIHVREWESVVFSYCNQSDLEAKQSGRALTAVAIYLID